jgi:hypothetical protein
MPVILRKAAEVAQSFTGTREEALKFQRPLPEWGAEGGHEGEKEDSGARRDDGCYKVKRDHFSHCAEGITKYDCTEYV